MQFDFLKKPWVKTSGIAALVGYLLSLVLVIIFGGGFGAILIKPLISAVLMGSVWAAIFFLLEKFVPDIIEEIAPSSGSEMMPTGDSSAEDLEDFNFDINEDRISSDLVNSGPEAGEQSVSEDIKIGNPMDRKVKKKVASSDEIMVEGVPMKKDPDLMARAIQHVLDSEKE